MRTIAFDMDGTLIGYKRDPSAPHGVRAYLRPGAKSWVRYARKHADRVILWTFASRGWYREMARKYPLLSEFDEVYTREDLENHVTTSAGPPTQVKDVRKLGVDLLIDNDPSHEEWGNRYGMGHRYLTVRTYGEI